MLFKPDIHVVERIGGGYLAVMPKPASGRGKDKEFERIAEFGIDRVVSLLETDEAKGYGLGDERELCESNGMEFVSYPIRDHGLPESLPDYARFTREIHEVIKGGTNTVVHCLAGIGRTGTIAAGVLLHASFEPQEAFDHISEARGYIVPDTEEQRQWVIANHREILELGKKMA